MTTYFHRPALEGPENSRSVEKHLECVLQVRIQFEFAGHIQVAIIDATSLKECSQKAREFIEAENLGSRDILSINVHNGRQRCASISYNGNITLFKEMTHDHIHV